MSTTSHPQFATPRRKKWRILRTHQGEVGRIPAQEHGYHAADPDEGRAEKHHDDEYRDLLPPRLPRLLLQVRSLLPRLAGHALRDPDTATDPEEAEVGKEEGAHARERPPHRRDAPPPLLLPHHVPLGDVRYLDPVPGVAVDRAGSGVRRVVERRAAAAATGLLVALVDHPDGDGARHDGRRHARVAVVGGGVLVVVVVPEVLGVWMTMAAGLPNFGVD